MRTIMLSFLLFIIACNAMSQSVNWQHLSSKNTGSGLEAPNAGDQQTSSAIADFNNDGINDFCISERTHAPAMVWYERVADGWKKQIVEDDILFIEAGTTVADVDGDGDLDIIAGGESKTNQVWWWENPYPNFDNPKGWNRYLIRNSGGTKIHDQMVGDFDGDGKTDLVFWAQGDNTLYFTRIPANPKELSNWKLIPVYTYFTDGQMEQLGKYPEFKGTNEHEGLSKDDINGDGIQDIIGGGMWFGYLGNDKFSFNMVDGSYPFSRSAVGQFIKGGRPEILLVIGDGWAPMNLYEYKEKTWMKKQIVEKVSNGHSLSVIDFDGDGNLDIWNAEMTLFANNTAVNHILLGDGKGNFPREIKISEGIDIHESEMADLDGDGDLDILGKPYNGNVPRIDIWLKNGTGEILTAKNGAFNQPFGLQLYSCRFEFNNNVPATLAKVKQMGINEVEVSSYYGSTAKDFNSFGEKLIKAGLCFFYHPHGYEFNTPDGNLMDFMLEQTKPELVTFELDVFWMTHGGACPLSYLKKYPGRFELMHLKELRNDTPGNNTGGAPDETSVSLGKGVTNWPLLLRQAVKSGTKKFYIEDEAKNAIDQIPVTINYLKSLK